MAITVEFGVPTAAETTFTVGFLTDLEITASTSTEKHVNTDGEPIEVLCTGYEKTMVGTLNWKSASTMPSIGGTLSYDTKTWYIEDIGEAWSVGKIKSVRITARYYPKLTATAYRTPQIT